MDPELRRFLGMAAASLDQIRRTYDRWRPITEVPSLVQPFFALAAVLSMAIVAGISMAALSTLVISLLVMQFLLVEVFGVSLDVRPS